jgi:hypothetical protein
MGYEGQHSFVDSSQNSNMEGQNWNYQPNFVGNTDGHRPSMAYMPANKEEKDNWSTPNKPAPPEISQVHSRIEAAARGGATVEKLLEDLALVTAKLNEARSGGDSASSIQQLRSVVEKWGPNTQTSRDRDDGDSKQSQSRSERDLMGGQDSGEKNVLAQTCTPSFARREDSNGGAESGSPPACGTEEINDDDGGSSYSGESTNSWATIEVGE